MVGITVQGAALTNGFYKWKADLRKLSPYARLMEIINRYPQGQPIEQILRLMHMGSTNKAKRQLDTYLRTLEAQGLARIIRLGDVRVWAKGITRTDPA